MAAQSARTGEEGGGWEDSFDASMVGEGAQAAAWLPKPSWEDTLRSSVAGDETWEDQLRTAVAPTRPPRSPSPPPRVPREGPEEAAARRSLEARAGLPPPPKSPFHPPSSASACGEEESTVSHGLLSPEPPRL